MKRLVLALSFAVLAQPSVAQDAEAPLIRLHVFAMDQPTESVDPNLPAGAWKWEPFGRGPDPYAYSLNVDQAREAVTALRRELQRTARRRRLIAVVETRAEGDVFLQVIATEANGSIKGAGIFPRGAGGAPSSVTTTRREPVMLLRLTIRNQVFSTDFLGTHLDLVRPPAFTVAQQVEEFVEDNYEALLQVKLPD